MVTRDTVSHNVIICGTSPPPVHLGRYIRAARTPSSFSPVFIFWLHRRGAVTGFSFPPREEAKLLSWDRIFMCEVDVHADTDWATASEKAFLDTITADVHLPARKSW